MLFGTKEERPDDILKKQEQFTEKIRRNNREEIFSKRRNIEKPPQQTEGQSTEERRKTYIVDYRFSQEIQKFLKIRYHLETLPELVKAIQDPDIIKQHYGLIGVRKILSIADFPPIQPIIDAGLVPKLIEYVQQQQYPQLQLQATWALTNVASGTLSQCKSIVDKGGIPLFIHLLKSECKEIVEQAIWAIGNIASDCSIHRDAIIKMGGIRNMIYAIENSTTSYIIEHGLWALSNLCRGEPMPRFESIKEAIPVLSVKIVEGWITQKQTLSDCLWALSHNVKFSPEEINVMLVETGFHKKIPQFLFEEDVGIVIPVIRIFGNITLSHDQLEEVLKIQGIMEGLSKLLNSDKKVMRTETCWVLSNIASGNTQQVNFLLNHDNLISKLLMLFETDVSSVKSEIASLFANLSTEGNPQNIFKFYQSFGIIKYYIENLRTDDPKLIKNCLQALSVILQLGEEFKVGNNNPFVNEILNGGGDKVLQDLQLHKDRNIYDQVVKLISDFFVVDESFNL